MHAAKILGALIFSTGLLLAAKVPVITQFEREISGLETRLAAEKNISKRYDDFLQTHAKLVKIKKDNPRQNEVDELAMGLFLDTLADFPAKRNFQAKKCPEYLKKTKTMMASRNKEEGNDPMVARAFKVAAAICR